MCVRVCVGGWVKNILQVCVCVCEREREIINYVCR